MFPTIDFQDEGNSVDPPHLQSIGRLSPQHLGEFFESEGSPTSSHAPHIGFSGSGLPNGSTFVFESSTTTSRARVKTFSAAAGMEKMSTLVIDRDAHTTSISTSKTISSLNESNSASAPRGVLGVDSKQFLSDLQFGPQRSEMSYEQPKINIENREQSECWKTNVNNEFREKPHITPLKQNNSDFSFNQTKLAYMLKPQLQSDFLSQEFSSTPKTAVSEPPIDVDAILKKYGLKTREYNPPITMDNQSYTPKSTVTSSTVSSYSSYSSCRFVSNTYNDSKAIQRPQMDVSQNNEALEKLVNSSAKATETEVKHPEASVTPRMSPQEASYISLTEKESLFQSTDLSVDQAVGHQLPCKTSHSSSNVDAAVVEDYSKNNDIEGLETSIDEASGLAEKKLSAAHGSSVDVAVNKLPYGEPYQGFTSSRPSNMDVSPFDGSYLKHYLAMSGRSTGTATPDRASIRPSTSTSNRDPLSLNGPHVGSATESLDYSLQKERYRLRGIDNMISSGPRHILSPFVTMPYRSIHSSSNFPIVSSYRNSATSFGSALSSKSSYSTPKDIASIRRAGSNVDTGQFNNNQQLTEYGCRKNRYGPEMAERLGVQEAWINESPGKQHRQKQNTSPHRQVAQKQILKQESRHQRTGRIAKSSGDQNIIERNRLAVSQYVIRQGKKVPYSKERKNVQRPKTAQAKNYATNGSNCVHQSNNSQLSDETKEILSLVNTEKRNSKDRIDLKSGNGTRKTKLTPNTRSNNVKIKGKEDNHDQKGEIWHPSVSNKRRTETLKYRPYLRKINKSVDNKQEKTAEIQSASELAISLSSSRASRSQASCDAGESNISSDENLVKSYPRESNRKKAVHRCHSYQDTSQHHLVTATALASALIRSRQQHFEKLCMYSHTYSLNEKKCTPGSNASRNGDYSCSQKRKTGWKKTSRNPKQNWQ